jgi:hypothetical protein
MPTNNPLADDLLHGAAEIGKYLGISERAAFHQIANGQIPTVKMGRLIVASKTVLRRHFAPVPEVKAS